jgi:hypothetical protein
VPADAAAAVLRRGERQAAVDVRATVLGWAVARQPLQESTSLAVRVAGSVGGGTDGTAQACTGLSPELLGCGRRRAVRGGD